MGTENLDTELKLRRELGRAKLQAANSRWQRTGGRELEAANWEQRTCVEIWISVRGVRRDFAIWMSCV